MGKTYRKAKTPPGEFQVTAPWTIPKYQLTVKPFHQSPIGIVLVEDFFACTDPSM